MARGKQQLNLTIGDNINKKMGELEITTAELAEYLGITRQALEGYIKGISKPPADKLLLLADKLQCSTDYLLGRETYSKPENLAITAAECGLSEETALALKYLYDNGETPTGKASGGMYDAESLAKLNRRAIHFINLVFESEFPRVVKVMNRPVFERTPLDNIFTLMDRYVTAKQDGSSNLTILKSGDFPEMYSPSEIMRTMRLFDIRDSLESLAEQYDSQKQEG